MPRKAFRRSRPTFWRLLLAIAALMLALGPNLMMSANAAIAAHDRSGTADFTVLLDDTPDVGPVNDAPPPVVGAVNLFFMGVLPAERLTTLPEFKLGRQTWPSVRTAPLDSLRPETPTRPPKS